MTAPLKLRPRFLVFCFMSAFLMILFLHSAGQASAAPIPLPTINFGLETAEKPTEVVKSLQILVLLTLLTLVPSILVLMTSFTRIIIVLGFVRQALAIQQMPPNQVMIGLALFLTFFVMSPTWAQVNEQALQPYLAGQLSQEQFYEKAMEPTRTFMFKQTRETDLALFVNLAKMERPKTYRDIPNHILIPAFIISELKTAFQIGAIIFIPFIVIDMVVASILMSMGMMMLPPMMISLSFKIILFVLVDGWGLVVQSLIKSFQ